MPKKIKNGVIKNPELVIKPCPQVCIDQEAQTVDAPLLFHRLGVEIDAVDDGLHLINLTLADFRHGCAAPPIGGGRTYYVVVDTYTSAPLPPAVV